MNYEHIYCDFSESMKIITQSRVLEKNPIIDDIAWIQIYTFFCL